MTRDKRGIKETTKTKNNKIKKYQSKINHYQQHRTFKNNQEKFYRELNSGGRNYEQKFLIRKRHRSFWGSIWGKRKEHWQDAEWLENVKRDSEYKKKQEAEITQKRLSRYYRKYQTEKNPVLTLFKVSV